MLHMPPKNFVCCIPNAVSQTKQPVNPKGMKQHNQTYWWILVAGFRILSVNHYEYEMNDHILLLQAVSQINVYHFYSKNVNDNEKW